MQKEEKEPWAKKVTSLASRIKAGHDQDMTGDKSISPTGALSEGPAVIAEKALTAEAAWHDAEPRAAEATTVAGTEAASNAAIFSENKDNRLFTNLTLSTDNWRYGKYRQNNFYNSQTEAFRRAYVC